MEEFEQLLAEPGGFVGAVTDGTDESELKIKERTKATLRIVLEDGGGVTGDCIVTGRPATRRALFAVSY